MQKIPSITTSNLLKGLLVISPLVIFLIFNYHNLLLKFSLLLGLIVFPYVIQAQPTKGNYRFAILSALFGILLLFVRSNSVYYFTTAFLILFIIDKWFGRINLLPFFLVVIVSPVISTIVYIWSFPIRLALSDIAGQLLQAAQFNIQIQGNLILLDGNTFSVDEACIGLNMVITALVLGTVIIAFFEKKYQYNIRFWQAIPTFLLMFLLTILANFIRLLTLIIFHILPENPLHDIVGLLSLAVYALMPFYFLVGFFFKKMANQSPKNPLSNQVIQKEKITLIEKVILALLIGLQLYISPQFLHQKIENTTPVNQLEITKFEKTITDRGVLKFKNEEALLYIKPPVKFFQGSHDPRFCWQGSGYEFSDIQLQEFNGNTLYTAILTKEQDQLYTAWWYQSPSSQTPYEWTWRWKNLKDQEAFFMVSVSCEKELSLEKWIVHLNGEMENLVD